jgi:2-methylcitrate dehydratase PrpD
MGDYLEDMCFYLSRCSFSDIPEEALWRAKEVLADSIAVIGAGAQEEEVKTLRERIVPSGGKGEATIIGTSARSEPAKAALINGTAGTFLELDEGNQFGRGHPGIHVIPAGLAVSEAMGFSGRDFLAALVLGYEVGTRIGIGCRLRMSMHPHGTWGTVGAAVAVGKLMGYSQAAMKEIINISSSLGLATSRRTMLEGGTVRNVYAGVSGYMGILAHDLVQSGFTGEADGLGTVYGSVVSQSFNAEAMVEGLGERFEIARNYFKRHACCRYNHGSLDALEKIMAQMPGHRIQPEDIENVEIETYSLAAQLCDQKPRNMLAAKFSIPFAIATFIVHGEAGIECFKPEAVDDSVTRELAGKVTVKEDPELTAMMPDRRPSRVRVILSSGKKLEAETFMNKGDFEDPYSAAELEDKYYSLADPIWGHKGAEAIRSRVMAFEALKDVNELTNLLAPLN